METVPGLADAANGTSSGQVRRWSLLVGVAGIALAACALPSSGRPAQTISAEPASVRTDAAKESASAAQPSAIASAGAASAPSGTPPNASPAPTATGELSQEQPIADDALRLPALAPAPEVIPLSAVEASFDPPRSAARRGDLEASQEQETRSVTVGVADGAQSCVVGGANAECTTLTDGPFVITDYEVLDGCRDRLYLASVPVQERQDAMGRLVLDWTVAVSAQGVHGARIAVAPEGRLVAVLQPTAQKPTRSPRCTITWSGYRLQRPAKAPTQPALMESPYR